MTVKTHPKSLTSYTKDILYIIFGSFLAALAIRIFLIPNELIDGGIIGFSLICARIFGHDYLSYFLIAFNLPFIYLAYKFIRKSFVLHMFFTVLIFAIFLFLLKNVTPFLGDSLEVIVFGGAALGSGVGLMIRGGASTDGTEILAIILNRKMGFTIGQIVLVINIFIFAIYGLLFQNWHIALQSLMMYIVAFKMIDLVITGLEEIKSVLIITQNSEKIKKTIMHQLGLGLTIIPSKGGFSGENKEVLLVIVERLELADLKEVILREDPSAFMAIETLHEIAYGKDIKQIYKKGKKRSIFKSLS